MQEQIFISKQEQEMKQLQKDSFILIDMIHRTISSAEKYALGNSKHKKYGYWDELDTANLKSDEELKFELYMKIQTIIGGLKEFNTLYPNVPIPFYDEIPKEVILNDLEYFKKIISSNKHKCDDIKLYDMLINILNGKTYNLISKSEIEKYYSKPLKKEDLGKYATEIFHQNYYSTQEIGKAKNNLEYSQSYQPGGLNIPPGRGYH